MTDLKTLILVIKQRISIAERNNQAFVDLPYDTVGDAIAMLKEQQQQIWELQDQVEYLTDKLKEHEVVRCKDCIWFHKPDAETKKSCKCNYHGCVTEEDKYCWWGENDA